MQYYFGLQVICKLQLELIPRAKQPEWHLCQSMKTFVTIFPPYFMSASHQTCNEVVIFPAGEILTSNFSRVAGTIGAEEDLRL